jgi:ornithine decarboxylase
MIPNEAKIIEKARQLHYPTPFFYTSKDILKHNYNTFASLFDGAEILYALKANSDPRILAYLDELGSGFEAASAFEIDMLLKVGVDPHKIVYGTSVKPASHIKLAVEYGVTRFAADSREEIEKLAEHAPGSKVFVRAIVDDEGSVFTMSERFGAPVDTVEDILLYAKDLDLKTYGISFYVGSQATNADRWAKGIRTIKPVIESLHGKGLMLETINIGGGFPVAYNNHKSAPHLKEIVSQVNNALHELPYIPKILMEPGRGIVASSTVLVTEVISRTKRKDEMWLCVDGGIYNALYEAMIHQGATQYDVHPFIVGEGDVKPMSCTLAGPTGDSLDIITRHAVLPAYITVGDRLIFENAGAYTVTMSCPFNGFPKPELYIS